MGGVSPSRFTETARLVDVCIFAILSQLGITEEQFRNLR